MGAATRDQGECMSSGENRNAYLDQVVAQQGELEQNLRSKRAAPPPSAPGAVGKRERVAAARATTSPAPAAMDIRVTGFWRWKTVLVPPNAYVVHTRRGHAEPLHVGLGTSFRFNPTTDSYLVVPGRHADHPDQRVLHLPASCRAWWSRRTCSGSSRTSRTAYRKLDFSDADDPMRLVNLQLKEQAEAAIKDKVATMSVHEVLSDKQPIIEELTARLRAVAEGEGEQRPRPRAAHRHRADQGGGRQLVAAVGEPAEAVPVGAGTHRAAGRARRRRRPSRVGS